MGNGTRGRPREEGERYRTGKLKPKPVIDTARKPLSGAVVQRMLSADAWLYSEANYGKEATRLWAAGQLAPAELATGLRFAGIYGRYEFHNGLPRSAPAPHYIREYIAEGIGDADQPKRDEEEDPKAALERRVRTADADFKWLQEVLSTEHRAVMEALFVDDLHVGYHLAKAKTALAVLAEAFRERENQGDGGKQKKRKKKGKERSGEATIDLPPLAAKPPNPAKIALQTLLAKTAPHLDDQGLEEAWNIYCALKSREDFRVEQSREDFRLEKAR
jgi:hypothetical protein